MIKDNLALLRKLHGYSQEDIAEKIGISRQAYGRWEKGETLPDIEKCVLLASVYGITLDSLIHTEKLDGKLLMPPPPKGKHIFGAVTVSGRGQIVIPKEARDMFGIESGDRLIVLGDETAGIALVKEKAFMEGICQAMESAGRRLD